MDATPLVQIPNFDLRIIRRADSNIVFVACHLADRATGNICFLTLIENKQKKTEGIRNSIAGSRMTEQLIALDPFAGPET